MNEFDPTQSGEINSRVLPRGNWQATVDAVLMREIFMPVLSEPVEITASDLPSIEENERVLSHGNLGFGDLWKTAYAVTDHARSMLFERALNQPLVVALNDQHTPLDSSLEAFTYNKFIDNHVSEALNTLACFPLNLARAVINAATMLQIDQPRFQPQSLLDIANLLDDTDIKQMIDESLITANESWGGFSVGYTDFAPTIFWKVHPRFTFTDGKVTYTEKMLRALHKPMKSNNARVLKQKSPTTEPSAISEKSSTGCPARYHHIHVSESAYTDELQWIASITGKSVGELGEVSDASVLTLGMATLTDVLRSADPICMPRLSTKREAIYEKYGKGDPERLRRVLHYTLYAE